MRKFRRLAYTIVAVGFVLIATTVVATEPADRPAIGPKSEPDRDAAMKFFENHIRPLLVERCFECHAGDKAEGGLRLDSLDAVTSGGDSGPVIVPGKPEESLLVAAVRYDDLEMPPDAPLSARQQADIVRWIRQGAYWPTPPGGSNPGAAPNDADHSSGATDESLTDESAADWWAARPIPHHPVPPRTPDHIAIALSSNHPTDGQPNAIDRYIDARLADAGLSRAPQTDRARLIRRLSYDLLGLPPSPEAVERFVNDDRPDAYQRLVDEMFANPAYGERMARLWLDLVRYADSDGWRADAFRPQAWRYRQFVVDAFNSAMPYDRFVQWQLAGDEIAPHDEQALAAVGFLRLGIYEYNQRDAEGQWQNIVDEITDVTADVFLATGMACAKCHDHKFDPIPRSDYYRMRSVFEPLSFVDWKRPRKPLPSHRGEIDALLEELKQIEGDAVKELGEAVVNKFPLHLQAMYRKPYDQRTTYEHQMAYLVGRQYLEEGLAGSKLEKKIGKEASQRRKEILARLDQLNANPYAPADLMTIADAPGDIRPTRLPGRSKGAAFAPGAPTIFGKTAFRAVAPPDAPHSSGRRTALANWITSPDNPITARVMVNRLWQYHFGTGLVSSPNDFGRLGNPPSHPQLLDFLARQFIDSGWNIQWIQRQIVNSQTYRQSSIHPEAPMARQRDANNRLLWHKSVRRLDAEQYRDTLLAATGQLIYQVGGPSVAGTPARRSLYLRRMRNTADEMLAALDTPPGIVGTAKRDVTTTAPQALMMLNSPRLLTTAKRFAERVRRDLQFESGEHFPTAFVHHAHRIISGADADPIAVELLTPLITDGESGQVDACHVLLNSNAFLFID